MKFHLFVIAQTLFVYEQVIFTVL